MGLCPPFTADNEADSEGLDQTVQLITMVLTVLVFKDVSTLVGHFLSSPRERDPEKDRRDSRVDEREG